MSRIETREHAMEFLFQTGFRNDPVSDQIDLFRETCPEITEDEPYFLARYVRKRRASPRRRTWWTRATARGLTEVEDIKSGKNTQKNFTKRVLKTWITMMV